MNSNCIQIPFWSWFIPEVSGEAYQYSFAGTGPFGSSAILSQGLGAGIYNVYIQATIKKSDPNWINSYINGSYFN